MNLLILGDADGAYRYRLLDKKLNELIETSECFLFNILCGVIEGEFYEKTLLGKEWGVNNGAPLRIYHGKTEEEVLRVLISKTDYAIFILDGNAQIKNIFMKYKMSGKHGSVIQV